jgi:hypothetical protein
MKTLSAILIALLLLPACSNEDAGNAAATSKSDTPVTSPRVSVEDSIVRQFADTSKLPKTGGTVVLVKDLAGAGLHNDRATISEAYASEKGVQLRIGYAGGCKAHTLTLHAVEGLEKSDPPSGHLYLSHDAGGDNCEAFITSDMAFDLTPLLAHYRDVAKYTGPVRLMIHEPGKKEPAQSIIVEVR